MMKTLFSFLFVFSFLCFQAQEKEEAFIKKIDRNIENDKTIVRKESSKKTSWNGGYETLVIYLKGRIPILIEKTENRVIHLYIKDPIKKEGERDEATLFSAKFYITNWNKKEYIRTGNIKNIGNPYNRNPNQEKIKEMPKNYEFEFDKNEVEILMSSEN